MTDFPRRRTARRRDLPADRRRAPRRGRRAIADPGDGGAAGARARQSGRQRPALRVAAWQPRSTRSSPTARANCSTAPARAASTCSFSPAARSTAKATSISSRVGDYDHPKARFPGSFGSAYLYYVVPKVILFRIEHSRRTLVPKVDFISAPGGSPANVFRSGGPIALVTNRCLFDFDRAPRALSPRQRPSRPQRRRGDRKHRLRVRPARRGADDAGAVGRDAAPDAHRRGADAGRGLSGVCQEGVWRRHSPAEGGHQKPLRLRIASPHDYGIVACAPPLDRVRIARCAPTAS